MSSHLCWFSSASVEIPASSLHVTIAGINESGDVIDEVTEATAAEETRDFDTETPVLLAYITKS